MVCVSLRLCGHYLCSLPTSSPGRFFASNEMKAMLAYIVLTYDVKLEREGMRPPNEWYGHHLVPNMKGKVMFRKRRI